MFKILRIAFVDTENVMIQIKPNRLQLRMNTNEDEISEMDK